MNSPDPLPQHVAGLLKTSAAPRDTSVPQQTPSDSAANDAVAADRRNELSLFKNPLWVMAIALGVFCVFTASVIALG